jgi:hypothetical protein
MQSANKTEKWVVKTYTNHRKANKYISAINDGFGISVACFQQSYLPGQIAERGVYKIEDINVDPIASRFRIVRRVTLEEVLMLRKMAGKTKRIDAGFWYEVIGD